MRGEDPERGEVRVEDAPAAPLKKDSVACVASRPLSATGSIDSAQSDAPPQPTGTPSKFSRARSVIPRSKRRGLLGRWTVLPELAEPYEYSRYVKWFLTFVIAVAGAAATMGSNIFFPALPQLTRDLETTPTVANLSVALYMLAMSIFPLWWSSFSETLGRRTIYITSFVLFVVFNVLCAVSTSMSMLIVTRVLVGGSAASVQAVGAGSIADIWEPRERGRAMGMFYMGPLSGPLVAPLVGGALAQKWGWRASMWFLAIWGAVVLVFLVFALPETLRAPEKPRVVSTGNVSLGRVSTVQSVRVQTSRWLLLARRSFVDPLKIILYLRFPAVLLTVYYASIAFGSLYVMNVSVQATFSKPPYSYSPLVIGLLYIPPSLGYILASFLGGPWTDHIMEREARAVGRLDDKGKPILRPEDRMRENAWLAAVLYPVALLWYGWASHKGAFWLIPMTANFFFGVGSMLIFSMATTMLTEFMPRASSSGVALNNFVRNIFSAVGGAVAAPLMVSIGNGWLFTALSALAAASGAVVWAMRRWGPGWRADMERRMG
ncbi:MAG: hypothetical protein M1832_006360 [Thelocarpon impressellum]|nr:MAG: hypothetical protein M1832_006360 [Thelocarpon impressellum]